MKKFLCSCMILAETCALWAAPDLLVFATREGASYRVGETVAFKVTAADVKAPLFYRIDTDGKAGPAQPLNGDTFTAKLDKPGFILAEVYAAPKEDQKKPVQCLAGAAVEPEKILPGRPAPKDFDSYWAGQLAGMRARPLKVELKPLPASDAGRGQSAYEVTLRRGDLTASGFMVLPKDAAPRSLPAIGFFLGAGKVNSELVAARGLAQQTKAIVFVLNFHGTENIVKPAPEQILERRKAVAKYMYTHAESPEKYAMRSIFLRVVMAMDYLKSRPEFDGRHLIAHGGSLGGCQAAVAAALVPEVSLCISTASAMCDHYGKEAGHAPGWPDLFATNPKAVETAGYFDVANFTPKIKCPTLMAVGFIDVVCPPASTYAAYNKLGTARKKMVHVIGGGHGGSLIKGEKGVFSLGSQETALHIKDQPPF